MPVGNGAGVLGARESRRHGEREKPHRRDGSTSFAEQSISTSETCRGASQEAATTATTRHLGECAPRGRGRPRACQGSRCVIAGVCRLQAHVSVCGRRRQCRAQGSDHDGSGDRGLRRWRLAWEECRHEVKRGQEEFQRQLGRRLFHTQCGRPASPIRPRVRQVDWRQGIASDRELMDRATGKIGGNRRQCSLLYFWTVAYLG